MANHTVLIIDYEPKSIQALSAPLERAGFNIEVARDGIAGITAFEKLSPALVFIEAMLPKKHGFEVCQEIKKSTSGKGTPVIITTGAYRGRRFRSQALHIYGCDDYLEKPFTEERLLDVCRRFLGDAFKTAPAAPAATEQSVQKATGTDGRPAPAPTASNPPPAVVSPVEQEISARLDAIMPGLLSDRPEQASAVDAEESSTVEPPEKPRPFEPSAGPSADLELSTQLPPSVTPLGELTSAKAQPADAELDLARSRKGRRKKNRGGGRRKRQESRAKTADNAEAASTDPVVEPTAAADEFAQEQIMSAEQMFAELAAEMEDELPASLFEPAASDSSRECIEAFPVPVEAAVVSEAPVEPEPVHGTSDRTNRGLWIAVAAVLVIGMAGTLLFVMRGRGTPADPSSSRRNSDAVESRNVVEPSTPSATRTPRYATMAQSLESGEAKAWQEPAKPVTIEPPDAGAVTPSPTTRRGDLINLHEVDQAPTTISRSPPDYPMASRRMKQQGTVILNVLVNEDGRVVEVEVIRGVTKNLDNAAARAARSWTYEPAEKDGVAVKVWKPEKILFEL